MLLDLLLFLLNDDDLRFLLLVVVELSDGSWRDFTASEARFMPSSGRASKEPESRSAAYSSPSLYCYGCIWGTLRNLQASEARIRRYSLSSNPGRHVSMRRKVALLYHSWQY